MSWYIFPRGENANRTYCEIYEFDGYHEGYPKPLDRIGPYPTKEEAEKAAKQRGLTLTSLKDLTK